MLLIFIKQLKEITVITKKRNIIIILCEIVTLKCAMSYIYLLVVYDWPLT